MSERSESLLTNRFRELSERSYSKSIYTHTDFLSLTEQSILNDLKLKPSPRFFGGFPGAERQLAYFGSEDEIGYPFYIPVVCIKITPVSEKFSEPLTHRDYLGALMNLGIERKALGDIVIQGKTAYLAAVLSVSDTVLSDLCTVRRTGVICSLCEFPEQNNSELKEKTLLTRSERVDALLSAVYKLSREESKKAITSGLAYINGKAVGSASNTVKKGQTVTLRGRGRFIYDGIARRGKKDALHVTIREY